MKIHLILLLCLWITSNAYSSHCDYKYNDNIILFGHNIESLRASISRIEHKLDNMINELKPLLNAIKKLKLAG